jgi:hypothetical protein
MKKALIFIGLISFAGAIIYATSFLGGDDDPEEDTKQKKSAEELHFIDEINSIESIEWSKDSIDNLKMSIQMSKNHDGISKKAQDNLLSHLENIESITLQNSFKVWLNSSCTSQLDSLMSNRVIELSEKRADDDKLQDVNLAISGIRLQQYYEGQLNQFIRGAYDKSRKDRLQKSITRYYGNSSLKNCSKYNNFKTKCLNELKSFESFFGDFDNYYKKIQDAIQNNDDSEMELQKDKLKRHFDYNEDGYLKYDYYNSQYMSIMNDNPEIGEKLIILKDIYNRFQLSSNPTSFTQEWRMFLQSIRTTDVQDAIKNTSEYRSLRNQLGYSL